MSKIVDIPNKVVKMEHSITKFKTRGQCK